MKIAIYSWSTSFAPQEVCDHLHGAGPAWGLRGNYRAAPPI